MRFEAKNLKNFPYHFNKVEEFILKGQKIRKEDFGSNIGGTLIWDDNLSDTNNLKKNNVWHLYFLFGMVEILSNFILVKNKNKEKHYIARLWYEYQPYFLFVNNIGQDGYIYIMNGGTLLPVYPDGSEVDDEQEKDYMGHEFLVDFIFETQKLFEDHENLKNRQAYIKETPQSILQKFLPCFIENIYDIPQDSILWETPLLKETMANYHALKKYAEEKGWL